MLNNRNIDCIFIRYSDGKDDVYDDVASIQDAKHNLLKLITTNGKIYIINMNCVIQLTVHYK